ncbi:MAG: glutamate-1-semialdehyde 2,1-aminomutase [Planctomycetota bacterium]|nr:glutamate-1-semialdehyde 2,1-aminomutase [Planctomycetota bacterium]
MSQREGVGPRSRALNEISAGLFPGGVSSPVRAFGGVGGKPPVIRRAQGALLFDVDGREYVDLVGAWGPMILGHGHPAVERAVVARVRRGIMTGTPSPDEPRLARLITRLMPAVERMRFVVSGTEACMSALRLARAATGRTKLIKFAGCYHGHADAFLASAGSGALTFGTPDSPGVPPEVVAATLVAPYNDLGAVEALLAAHPGEVAAVFVEPIAGNMGFVPPEPGFLAGLRSACTRHGALLVFDEVMTGFRVHLGGAQALYGITPDLTTFGKIIGGGLPVGAYGGRADLMARVAPEGPVYQAGTLAGNPVAMTAGHRTLRVLARPGVFERIAACTSELAAGLAADGRDAGVPIVATSIGAMLGLWFAAAAPTNLVEAQATDLARFRRYHGAMLARGVHLPPSPFEAWFVSLAHDAPIIERIRSAHREALRAS